MPWGVAVCPSCRALLPRASLHGDLGPGTQIDRGDARLVIDARLGSGAMGTVYRAWMFYDPKGPRGGTPAHPVAVKQIKMENAGDPQLRAFFLNEAEAMRQLDHPNVVRFIDLFDWKPPASPYMFSPASLPAVSVPPRSDPARPLLAMEFVDGDPLDAVLARTVARAKLAGGGALPGMPFARAWYYVQQLLGALAATHALDIVHRDVKPSNVVIRRDGVAKLTDYGIAHLARPAVAQPAPSALAPGTGAYMSPEQVLGRDLDGRSDLYAAAIVLYELLSGEVPFPPDGRSELTVRIDQVERQPPPIRNRLPQAPPVLDELFTRALAKDPAARFGSAVELGEAFRRALGLPETVEWRAQAEMADLVARKGQTVVLRAGAEARVDGLRQALRKGYQTQFLGSRQPAST